MTAERIDRPRPRPSRRGRGRWRSGPAGVLALLLPALAASGEGASAQQRPVAGSVVHRETAAPLPGVFVALEERSSDDPVATALTDASGRFVLGGLEGRRYRLRFERVGLASEVTDWFTLGDAGVERRVTLAERAVELGGLDVRARARTCGLDAADAVVVQRWWDEVRKALEVAAGTGATREGRLRIEEFERELNPSLRMVGRERVLGTQSLIGTRPFRAQDASTLAERGFVQGEDGSRVYLAPDAAVLFSDAFLDHHCLAIADGDDAPDGEAAAERPGELRISVRPTRVAPTDIRGVLSIDTVAGELRSFDYRYVNLPQELPVNRAGGHLTFGYLPSGAWIVSDWWIRMPRIGLQRQGSLVTEVVQILAGYVERGGRVVSVGGTPYDPDRGLGRGTVAGVVFDSLSRAPLADARVSVVGTRLSTRTGPDGAFRLDAVPAGRRRITVHHASLARLRLPSPTLGISLDDGDTEQVDIVTPGFATFSRLLCGEAVSGEAAILGGVILEPMSGDPAPGADLVATWSAGDGTGRRLEARAGSDGRYVACGLPAGVPVELAVRTGDDGPWRSGGTVELQAARIAARDLRPAEEAPASIRGRVRSSTGDAGLPGARVAVVTVRGDTVAATQADSAGAFSLRVPPAVGYRAVAEAEGHWPETSSPFTAEGGDPLQLDVRLSPTPGEGSFELDGFLVEVETAQRTLVRRRLSLFGTSPEQLGRRWIGREAIDSIAFAGGDPGVAIQARGIPGMRVAQEERTGSDPRLCVLANRPRSPCALVVLNGSRIDPRSALSLDFRDMEGIAVLRPQEAMNLFGGDGRGGAVLLWSRNARR